MHKPKESLYQQAVELIQQLSQKNLRIAVDYLMYLQDKEEWEATQELMDAPEIVASLKRSEADTKAGRLRSWKNVRRDV